MKYVPENFLAFLKRESPDSCRFIATMAVLSGIANGALLSLINVGASEASTDTTNNRTVLLFVLAMLIYVIGKKLSLTRSTKLLEEILKKLRLRISDRIRKSELVLVEKLRKGELYTKIYQETNIISRTSFYVIDAAQSGVMLVFCFIYIAYLSRIAFLISLVSVIICLYSYYNLRKSIMSDLDEITEKESLLVDSLGHLIDGFKEIKLSSKRSDSFFRDFTGRSEETEDLRVKTGVKFSSDLMFFNVFFYLLIATAVFLLPRVMSSYSEVAFKMTAAILFIIGPLGSMVKGVPFLYRANVALSNLYRLEEKLESLLRGDRVVTKKDIHDFGDFKEIRLRKASFAYMVKEGASVFELGPVNMKLKKGERVFIQGENGCGKSTLLKLLTGLYVPDSGLIEVDDRAVSANTLAGYRELFSAVFSDFHLFDRLYGLEDVDEGMVVKLIHDMELEEKTAYGNGRFTDLDLSTSQKKRLALIVALLEDKEVYVFDEWAAEQDTHFKSRFYNYILDNLKEQGKTVVAVTHDEDYLSVADRIVRMENGQIIEETNNQ